MTQENFDQALALTRIGAKVFPWKVIVRDGKESKTPLTPNGHLAATDDPEQIATWFLSEFPGPDVKVGVHVGASGLVVADVDRKDGKDGFQSTEGWLDFPDTFTVDTATGGKHYIYEAPENMRLAPSGNFKGFRGLDVRGGSSWIAWWADEVPSDRSVFAKAPDWICEPAREVVGGAFEGGLDDWINSLVEPDAEPTGRVLDAIQRIPTDDFGRFELLERQYEFVRLAAEGAPGIMHGLRMLRDEWLRDPWDTDDNRYTFDKGLDGAIRKAGALDERIANLPKMAELLDNASSDVVNAIVGPDKPKGHWFRTAKLLVREGYSDDEVLGFMWQGGTVKNLSREWGADFCIQRLTEVREQVEQEKAEAAKVEVTPESPDETKAFTELLTPSERKFLEARPNFVHRYLRYTGSRFTRINPNYHRAAAFTILSLGFAGHGFIVPMGKAMSCNLYQNVLGESSTGKTEALKVRREITQLLFAEDQHYLVGSESSPEMLHEAMLERSGAPTLFADDEAAQFFAKLNSANHWGSGLETKLTDWYEGWVNPVRKRAAKTDGKGGPCYLVAEFFSTPRRLFKEMTTDQFLSGFLARFLWSVGEPADETADRHRHRQSAPDVAHQAVDPGVEEIVEEIRGLRALVGLRRPILADDESLARLEENSVKMEGVLRSSGRWDITEAAFRRMRDSIWKSAGLLAMSRGSTSIEIVDVLGAVEQAEVWLEGLLYASAQISSSQIERDAREIALFIRSKGDPWVSERVVFRHFSRYTPKEFAERIEHNTRTGMIHVTPDGGSVKYAWRGGEE